MFRSFRRRPWSRTGFSHADGGKSEKDEHMAGRSVGGEPISFSISRMAF